MGSIDALSVGKPWNVPPLVVECVRFVDKFGYEAEGIFRISPPVSVVQDVKNAMSDTPSSEGPGRLRRKFSSRKDISRGKNDGSEENKYDAISSITDDPHVAAHIVKDFLRKLDEPLFPTSINAQLIAAVKEKDFNTKISLYKQIITNLSVSCCRVLIAIGFLAKHVVKHTAANKMSYQALGVVFGPCLIRLDPMQMIEMWDSRITEELFGNFGAIVEGVNESEFQVVAQIIDVPEVKFTKDPPMTAKVTMLNKADMGEDAGEVDLQINVAFVGDEDPHKFELFCACAAKQAPIDPVRAKMRKAYLRPLESVAMLDTGTKVGVSLRYVFDWKVGGGGGVGGGAVPPPKAPRNKAGGPAPSGPPALPSAPPSAPLPPPLAAGNLPLPAIPPSSLPPPPAALPPPPSAGGGGPLVASSSVPVTKQEKKQVSQDYQELLKTSNVLVLPFSICEPKSLEVIVDKWIPALVDMQVTAPIVLVGCEKEKRVEGAEGLVTEEQAKGLRAEFSSVEKYVEVSTVTYKGFRGLADAGLDAFLLDYHQKQQKRRVTETPTPKAPSLAATMSVPSMPANPNPPPSRANSASKVKGKGGKEECVVM